MKKYWEKINIDIINWEKLFGRPADHKYCNIPWLVNFNICKINELFEHFFVHFLCTIFVTYFNTFLSSGNKVFREDANYIKEIYFNKENVLTGRDEMFNWS